MCMPFFVEHASSEDKIKGEMNCMLYEIERRVSVLFVC